jgi:hypothetical protein
MQQVRDDQVYGSETKSRHQGSRIRRSCTKGRTPEHWAMDATRVRHWLQKATQKIDIWMQGRFRNKVLISLAFYEIRMIRKYDSGSVCPGQQTVRQTERLRKTFEGVLQSLLVIIKMITAYYERALFASLFETMHFVSCADTRSSFAKCSEQLWPPRMFPSTAGGPFRLTPV